MNSALLLVNKRQGITSFDALGPIKKALVGMKVGHTGTLDKFAEGLLVVLCGRALKLSQYFLHSDKHYTGTILFGEESDTLDPEGQIIARAPPPSLHVLESVLPQFTGKIMQKPPLYSALHIDGKRAHTLARAGIKRELEARPVSIYSLELLSYDLSHANIAVHCSSGTYIRSLARDIALAAGSRGHLVSLCRSAVAGFSLLDAVSTDSTDKIQAALRPIDKSIFEKIRIPSIELDEKTTGAMRFGKDLNDLLKDFKSLPVDEIKPVSPDSAEKPFAVFCGDDFIAIIIRSQYGWRYGSVH